MTSELEAVGTELLSDVDDITRRLVREVLREIPELGADETLVEDLEPAVRATLVAWFGILKRGVPAAETAPPEDVLALARAWILRGTPLAALLRFYRLGHGFVMREWLTVTQRAGHDADAFGQLTDRALELSFAYVDGMSVQVSDFYATERARLVRSAEVARADTVRALLDGTPVDLDGASRGLGHELRRWHVGMVLWSDPAAEEQDPLGALDAAADEISAEMGAARPLLVPAGRNLLWAWCGLGAEPDRETVSAPARGRRRRDGVSVAIGSAREGAEGFVASHREAVEARRVAVLSRPPGRITLFADIDLVALLTADPDGARRFVRSQLGELAADDDATARLRATLRIYLDEGRSFVAVARRLAIHENTVKYRVRRCAELLGRPVDEQPLKLAAALLLSQTLSSAADKR